MPEYRRPKIGGGVFFFTVTLADRPSDLLLRHIDRLRSTYASVQDRYPFETIAICVLPEHLHAVWALPEDDANFSLRWNVIKGAFTRGLPAHETRRRSHSPAVSGESGNVATGSMPFAMTAIWRATSITFISIPSSTDTSHAYATGRTAASIVTSNGDCFRWIGAAICARSPGISGSERPVVRTARAKSARLCAPYGARRVRKGAVKDR